MARTRSRCVPSARRATPIRGPRRHVDVDTSPPNTRFAAIEPNPTNDATGDFAFTDATGLDVRMLARWRLVRDVLQPVRHGGVHRGHPHAGRPRHRRGENTDPTPASHTWLVDARPPETTIATFPPNPTNDPSGGFRFTSAEPRRSSARSTAPRSPRAQPVSRRRPRQGVAHPIAVKAPDNAGNTDATPATHSWAVDTRPRTRRSPRRNRTRPNDPTGDFTFTSTESATFECAVDGSAFAACTARFSTASSARAHTRTDAGLAMPRTTPTQRPPRTAGPWTPALPRRRPRSRAEPDERPHR